MNKTLQTLLCAAGIALAQHAAAYDAVTNERLLKPEPQNWLMYRGTYNGHGYSPLDKINTANVKRLVPVWSFSTGQIEGHQAPPIVNNGVMFISTPQNQVLALNAKTGEQIWQYKREFADDVQHHFAPVRRVAVFEHINALPGTQRQPAFVQRDADTGLCQGRADVRRHVVGPFGGMAEARAAFGEIREEILQILLHIRIGIFLDQQRGRGMADETGQKAIRDFRAAHKIGRLFREFIEARTARGDGNAMENLSHPGFRRYT